MTIRLLPFLALLACQAPIESDATSPVGEPLAPGITSQTMIMTTSGITPITPMAGARFEVLDATIGTPAAPSPNGAALFDLEWQGETLSGQLSGSAIRDGDTLFFGADEIDPRVGEARFRAVSVGVSAIGFQTGAILPATLYYFETPDDSDVLDVLLAASVEVEVVAGSGLPGTVASVRVMEASLSPSQQVGAAIAGDLYAGGFEVELDPTASLDCGPLTSDQLVFVQDTPADLGVEGNLHIGREHQGSDPMAPFYATGSPIDALTRWNGTRRLERVPNSGGILEVSFTDDSAVGMDTVAGPGIYEVARTLRVDARQFDAGFPIQLVRSYADAPQTARGDATCTVTFDGTMSAL